MCSIEEEAQKLSGRTHKCTRSRSGYPVSLVDDSGDVVAAVRHECMTRFAVKNQGEELKVCRTCGATEADTRVLFPLSLPWTCPSRHAGACDFGECHEDQTLAIA